MKLWEIMTNPVIRIHPEETVAVAARTLARYNIGALPVCGSNGRLCGLVTDRDLVTRCLASGRSPGVTAVSEVMTAQVVSVGPDMELAEAAQVMGSRQVRRLPVVENGKLCGMVSLSDLVGAREERTKAVTALGQVSANLSSRR